MKIKNEKQLRIRIRELETEKLQLEAAIVGNGAKVYEVLTNPAPILKQAVRDMAADRSFRKDALGIALNLLANYAGKKISESPTVSRITENLIDRLFRDKTEAEEGESLFQKILSIFKKNQEEKD